MLGATYEKLLTLFIGAQRQSCADAVCNVLKRKSEENTGNLFLTH